MATSGTYAFTLDINEIIEEAIDRAGGQPTLGSDVKIAKRSLNLLLTDWSNQGINLWTLEQTTITLIAGVSEYTLNPKACDILDATRRTVSGSDYTDIAIERISYGDYLEIPNKDQSAPPTEYYVRRDRDAATVVVWPTPQTGTTDLLLVWQINYIQDVTKIAGQNADVPKRFLPALTAGLAVEILMKRLPTLKDEARAWKIILDELKANYAEKLMFAKEEDRMRGSWHIIPRVRY